MNFEKSQIIIIIGTLIATLVTAYLYYSYSSPQNTPHTQADSEKVKIDQTQTNQDPSNSNQIKEPGRNAQYSSKVVRFAGWEIALPTEHQIEYLGTTNPPLDSCENLQTDIIVSKDQKIAFTIKQTRDLANSEDLSEILIKTLPQAADPNSVKSTEISINQHTFTKVVYDIYSLPERDTKLETNYAYGFRNSQKTVVIANVSLPETEMEEILDTLTTDAQC